MEVSIFTLKISIENENSIDDFVKEFDNIPRYLELEGGGEEDYDGCEYLFCIDSSINYKEIIKKYGYIYDNYDYKMKIDKKLYNNKYQIRINYFKNSESYRLEEVI